MTIPELIERWRSEHVGHDPFTCHCWYCDKAKQLQQKQGRHPIKDAGGPE